MGQRVKGTYSLVLKRNRGYGEEIKREFELN